VDEVAAVREAQQSDARHVCSYPDDVSLRDEGITLRKSDKALGQAPRQQRHGRTYGGGDGAVN
jgi:hypothetical protein